MNGGYQQQIIHLGRRLYHTWRMGEYPLFCNGIPKAGSHLLLNILRQLPKFEDLDRKAHYLYLNQGKVPPAVSNTVKDTCSRIKGCFPGEIMKVHLAYHDRIANVFREMEAKHLLIIRDPRAIVLSMADWWERIERPDLWAWRYFQSLSSREEKIQFLIKGWPENPKKSYPKDVPFPDLGQRMQQFVPWLNDYQSMVVRFEDLVNRKTTEAQIRKMVGYLIKSNEPKKQNKVVDKMMAGTDPKLSKTFQTGDPDRWMKELSQEALDLAQKYAGKQIEAMGYSIDLAICA